MKTKQKLAQMRDYYQTDDARTAIRLAYRNRDITAKQAAKLTEYAKRHAPEPVLA